MKVNLMPIRDWWMLRKHQEQIYLIAALGTLSAITLSALWIWIEAEQARLKNALPVARSNLQRMQDEAGECDRLRSQTFAAPLQGQSLLDAINASLHNRSLDLAVNAEGNGGIHVEGTAAFDAVIDWVAKMQQDHRLHITSLTVSRLATGVKLTATLSPAQ